MKFIVFIFEKRISTKFGQLQADKIIKDIYNCVNYINIGQSRWQRGLRRRRECGFESCPVHGCLSVSVVCCQVEVCATS